jgi:hypothetical protein
LQGIEKSYWFLHFTVARHLLLNILGNISTSDYLHRWKLGNDLKWDSRCQRINVLRIWWTSE